MTSFNWNNPYPSIRMPLFARNVFHQGVSQYTWMMAFSGKGRRTLT